MKLVVCLFLFLSTTLVALAQQGDTTLYWTDTTVIDYDTVYSEEDEYESESLEGATFTKKPGELNSTQREREKSYTKKKFSKTEWKKITEDANYSEDAVEKEKKKETRAPAWNSEALNLIAYILLGGLIVTAIFFLVKYAMSAKDTIKIKSVNDMHFYDTGQLDDVRDIDLDKLLREALSQNDYRAAVRIYYLKLLKHLDTTGYIAWKKDKTNMEYATELSAAAFVRDFRRLMTAYEIIWYGERTPTADEFKKIELSFNNLQSQARKA